AVVARDRARLGRDVGQVYVVNTLGAIVGTVVAGFVLIPAIGVHASIKVGIITNLLLAAGLFAISPSAWRWGALGPALAAGIALSLPASASVLWRSSERCGRPRASWPESMPTPSRAVAYARC